MAIQVGGGAPGEVSKSRRFTDENNPITSREVKLLKETPELAYIILKGFPEAKITDMDLNKDGAIGREEMAEFLISSFDNKYQWGVFSKARGADDTRKAVKNALIAGFTGGGAFAIGGGMGQLTATTKNQVLNDAAKKDLLSFLKNLETFYQSKGISFNAQAEFNKIPDYDKSDKIKTKKGGSAPRRGHHR